VSSPPCLHKVDLRQAGDALVKVVNAQQLAENQARIVKTQCLIEIADEQKLFSPVCAIYCCFARCGLATWEEGQFRSTTSSSLC